MVVLTMRLSIESHIQKYNMSFCDVALSVTTGFSGLPYAIRHWELSRQSGQPVWKHRVIALIEAFPLLGGLIALIERISISLIKFARSSGDVFSPEQTFIPWTSQKILRYLDKYKLTPSEKNHIICKCSQSNRALNRTHANATPDECERTILDEFSGVANPPAYFDKIVRFSTILHEFVNGFNTLLGMAIACGNYEVALRIIENASDNRQLNIQDDWFRDPTQTINGKYRNTPLHTIVAKGYVRQTLAGEALSVTGVQLMFSALTKGANPNIQNELGNTPLHLAYIRGDQQMINLLTRYNANAEIRNNEGKTPPELAYCDDEVKDRILELTTRFHNPIALTSIRADESMTFKWTSSEMSLFLDKYELTIDEKLHMIKDCSSKFHRRIQDNDSEERCERLILCCFICSKNPPHYFDKIVSHSTILHEFVDGVNTLLSWTIANGVYETALRVIENAPDNRHLDVQDNYSNSYKANDPQVLKNRNSPLHLIIGKGYVTQTLEGEALSVTSFQLVFELLNRGANPNLQNKEGNTPLHLAYIRRDFQMIDLLIRYNADKEIQNHDGKTPQELLHCNDEQRESVLRLTVSPRAPL